MEEEDSNDVVVIEDENSTEGNGRRGLYHVVLIEDENSTEARPLMSLFERLISSDTKSNTILTNAQILSILTREFHIEATTLHPLEIDIYINIVKKFLKDWPQWDAFDRIMNRLKKKGEHDEIRYILEQKYRHLKEYLQSMIDIATPLANDAVKKVKNMPEAKQVEEAKDIVLEVYCTRKMLNTFIYKQPNPNENNSVFNLIPYEQMKLNPSAPTYTFSSLLHWYGVRLTVELPFFQYTRYTAHRMTHVLVNEKNGTRDKNKELDTSVFMKTNSKAITNSIPISNIKSVLDKVLLLYKYKIECEMITAIFDVIKNDLTLESNTVDMPGSYKQHLNKYGYVRRLYADVPEAPPSPHNFYIEESITPIQDWHIGKFLHINMEIKMPPIQQWLKFECGECKQKFNGAEFLTLLREHFRVCHVDEPDWTCTNCERTFAMKALTNAGWRHNC